MLVILPLNLKYGSHRNTTIKYEIFYPFDLSGYRLNRYFLWAGLETYLLPTILFLSGNYLREFLRYNRTPTSLVLTLLADPFAIVGSK